MIGIKELEYFTDITMDLAHCISVHIGYDSNEELFFGISDGILQKHVDGWQLKYTPYGKCSHASYCEAVNTEKGFIVIGDFENEMIHANSIQAMNEFVKSFPFGIFED